MKENLSAELNRFKAVVETYGAREDAWPAADLPLMRKLLSSSDVARSLLRQEEKFDQLLQSDARPITAPSALLSRILEGAEDANRGSILKILWPFGSIWQPASGLLMAACIGVLLGLASPNILDYSDDLSLDEAAFSGGTMYDLEINNDNL
ncbi:MAG: hypothetical protein K9G33_09395 [Sneathiella sp.]|nr:hypothetical protein [Sneathiella sp.]